MFSENYIIRITQALESIAESLAVLAKTPAADKKDFNHDIQAPAVGASPFAQPNAVITPPAELASEAPMEGVAPTKRKRRTKAEMAAANAEANAAAPELPTVADLPTEQARQHNYTEIKALFAKCLAEKGVIKCKAILDRLGCETVKSIPETLFDRAHALLTATLAGADPQAVIEGGA